MKSDSVIEHIRVREWLITGNGIEFFNGHFNNDAVRVHGDHQLGVRMDLTSQVMPIMFDVVTNEQIKKFTRLQNFI
jgi:hypothetical protein